MEQRNKDVKYYLSEGIGGLILFVLLGFPLWLPMIFVVGDFMEPTNIFRRLIQGEAIPSIQIFQDILQYLVMFVPGFIIFVWLKTSDDKEEGKVIDGGFITSKQDFSGSDSVSWKPKGISGNPKNSAEWKQLKSGIYGFKSNYRYQYFTYPVVIGSTIYIGLSLYSSDVSFLNALASVAGLILMIAIFCNIAFYLMSHSGVWIKEKDNKVQVGVNLLDYSDIVFVQLIAKTQTHTNGGGEPYSVYEANVVYQNNQRHNMLNHGDLFKFIEQIRVFNSYLNASIVASEELLEKIESHNKEIGVAG